MKGDGRFRNAVLWQCAGLALGAAALWWSARHFPVVEHITRAQHAIGRMEVWGGVLYPLLYAGCNVLLLPGGVLAIGSGLFFGLWWGTAINLAGNLLGAAVAFGLARLIGRRWLVARLLAQPRWAALDGAIGRHGWKIIFLTQVHPLFPTSLLNYLYGVTRMRFGTCMLWVALGQAPGLFLYAYLGTLTQHGLRLLRGQSHPQAHEYMVWLGGLVLAVVVTTALGRLAHRVLAESREGGAS
ncbi:MAG: TVP38/TMEM64 family protein [Chthoniobacteraceae bacterium]